MAKTYPYVITIDGASGSGKGSLALQIAKKLGFHLLDSGAIYRLAALSVLRQEVDLSEQANVLAAIRDMDIRFEPGEELSIPFLDNEDVSAQIRQESTGSAASVMAYSEPVLNRLDWWRMVGIWVQLYFQKPNLSFFYMRQSKFVL